eukprot:3363645-Rhodomonas_salina.2
MTSPHFGRSNSMGTTAPPLNMGSLDAFSVLRACYALSGTALLYCNHVSGTEGAYGGAVTRCPATSHPAPLPRGISLRARYAVSGTEIAHGAISHARATRCPIAYGAMRRAVLNSIWLFAVSGTEIASAATGTSDYVVGIVLLPSLRACYAMSGTELAYGGRPSVVPGREAEAKCRGD